MRKLQILTSAVALLSSFALSAGTASAVVINGDFDDSPSNHYVGTAAAPDSGTVWNSLLAGTGTSAALSDSTGAATAVTITTDLAGPVSNGSYVGMPAANLLTDYAYDGSSITFNNVPAGTYDLYLYNVNGASQNSGVKFNFGSDKFITNDGSSPTGFVVGINYTVFTGLSPVAGQIAGTIANTNANHSAFNGFQLVQLPEPASVGVFAVSGLVVGLRRRRA